MQNRVIQRNKKRINKKQLGQFFTTNTSHILEGLEQYVFGKDVIDCFAGAGDLLKWAVVNNAKSIRGYDIDDKYIDNKVVFFNNSLENPVKGDFILTNPPYLYQNKLKDNGILRYSKHTDLYQLSLEKIMNSNEGIAIVPINFLSAENSKYIRDIFLDKFEIVKVNYFTEQVFDDTTYNVISFYYKKKRKCKDNMMINFMIYPQKKYKQIQLFKKYHWQIGGEFLNDINKYSNQLKITRLEENDLKNGEFVINVAYNHLDTKRQFKVDKSTYTKVKNNIVLLKAIDTGTTAGKIRLEDVRQYGYDGLVSIKTSRNQINLIFPQTVSIEEQQQLIHLFNEELENKRNKYNSLFMTNYRDKDRKRISFNFAYNFINYLYFNKLKVVSENVKI